MWNFETELSVRDCVRGVVVSNRAGVCHLLLETGESALYCVEAAARWKRTACQHRL